MAKKITPAQIERIGLLLFGKGWPREMGRAYGRSRQAMYVWKTEGAPRKVFLQLTRDHCREMMRNATKALDIVDKLDPPE